MLYIVIFRATTEKTVQGDTLKYSKQIKMESEKNVQITHRKARETEQLKMEKKL